MDRVEQLKYCTICKKRQFDIEKGVLCSLTGDYADFEGACPTYEFDQDEFTKIEQRKSLQANNQNRTVSGAHAPKKSNVQMVLGIIIIVIAVVLLFLNLSIGADGIRLLTPFILIIGGIITIARNAK